MENLATGIVRRVDELGRVVIPKEMRRTLRIKEGEEMEVSVKNGNEIVLRKYSAAKAMKELATELCGSLADISGHTALICDTDEVISSSSDKNIFEGEHISTQLEDVLLQRKSTHFSGGDFKIAKEERPFKEAAVCPVIAGGDIVGGVILAAHSPIAENSKRLAELTASFFAKQF